MVGAGDERVAEHRIVPPPGNTQSPNDRSAWPVVPSVKVTVAEARWSPFEAVPMNDSRVPDSWIVCPAGTTLSGRPDGAAGQVNVVPAA